MNTEEFRTKVRELLAAHLLKDTVDDITDIIVRATKPDDYVKTLVEIEDSFDWSTTT